ncbi:MAG: isocitrate lyase/PEP mutase family protein [Methanobacterium sp.]|nr:isocitrate lyase/PEP mutase family protein [Methanobacterium sp.]
MNKSIILRKLINSDQTLIMPDAYDPISAKLIENTGFKAVQCSGYSFSIAAGYENERDVSLDENLLWTKKIVEAVNVPVMADAEDGYGGPEEVLETVERFIKIGVAGLNLEDQIPDGKSTVSVIDEDLMMHKIMVAREIAEVKNNPDLVINGRTDALKSASDRDEGLDMAIERANLYLDVGADLAFITYVETLDEVKRINQEVNGPVSIAAGMPYNLENFSINHLKQLGVSRVSLPTLLIFSSINTLLKSLNLIKNDQMTEILDEWILNPVPDLNRILKKI